MPILHMEPSRDHAELLEAKTLIQMSRMNIAFYNRIELQHTESKFSPFFKAIKYKLFTYVLSPVFR